MKKRLAALGLLLLGIGAGVTGCVVHPHRRHDVIVTGPSHHHHGPPPRRQYVERHDHFDHHGGGHHGPRGRRW